MSLPKQTINIVTRLGPCLLLWLHLLPQNTESLNWNLHGKPGNGYFISVDIGFPPQKFNLLVDTGSSNLAIAGAPYPGLESYYDVSKSTTFILNGTIVKVMYTQGWWKGFMGQDFVNIASLEYVEPILTDLAIINKTHGFYVNNSHWQGILGLAYSKIAKPHGFATSWLDSLSEASLNISDELFELQLCGPDANRETHYGRFSVGTFQNICHKTEFSTQILHRWYYEVLITGLKVGNNEIDARCSDFNSPKTIVDSGTSNLQLSHKSYDRVISELRRQTEENLVEIDEEFWAGKKEICFSNSGKEWDLFPAITIFLNHDNETQFGLRIPSKSYLRPALNRTDQECWTLGIEKAEIGTVLGTVALEGFCLMFDRRNGFITFAEANCGPPVTLFPIKKKIDSSPCNYVVHVVNGPLIASTVILTLVLLPLLFAFVRWLWVDYCRPKANATSVPFIYLDETNT